MEEDFYGNSFPSATSTDELSGWYHIDVTRNSIGHNFAYVNDTLHLWDIYTTNSEASKSHFMSEAGPAIDNVVVSDSIDIDPLRCSAIRGRHGQGHLRSCIHTLQAREANVTPSTMQVLDAD
ncbi:MAG: hypothetical protein ACW97O_09190 [Candidatus Thorarchaeota archaeon]